MRTADPTGMDLADHGNFWVGVEPKTMPYGVIARGQMYVQYMVPKVVRHPYPVVLVHGGAGSMLHYMGGGNGEAGWAHYYVQAGYRVYLVDRPGHGRCPYLADALGPAAPIATYEDILPFFRSGKAGGRWTGTAEIGDPAVDQFMAGQNPAPADNDMAMDLWRTRGAELLDRIGPAIIQTHSAGGPFGWLVANERPQLTKAVVTFEGVGAPLIAQGPPGGRAPAIRALPNLKGIPMVFYTSPQSGWTTGPAIVAALNASGARAEHIAFADKGVRGNGHFAMFETNRREVFDLIRGWVDGVA
jgi:pimeloyl-ACP methyl ester carboxylesterase